MPERQDQRRHEGSPRPAQGRARDSASSDAHTARLRRIEGQVRGLQRMVGDDAYCIDILTQVSAVTRALDAFALQLLDEHLRHCVTEAIQAGGDEADEKIREASQAISRLVKS